MGERKQVDLTTNFLVSLMEEQLEIQQHVAVELTNIPQISQQESLHHLASRIVEEAKAVTPRGMAEDVLARAGIDNRLPAEPRVKKGHLRHVGKRARKIARNERKVKVRKQSREHNLDQQLVMKICLENEQEKLPVKS